MVKEIYVKIVLTDRSAFIDLRNNTVKQYSPTAKLIGTHYNL